MTVYEAWEKIKNSPSELWWRVAAWLLSTFVILPNITFIFYFVYMEQNDFFSYDFFSGGTTGMKIFILSPIIPMIIVGLLINSIIPICAFLLDFNFRERKKSHARDISISICRARKFFLGVPYAIIVTIATSSCIYLAGTALTNRNGNLFYMSLFIYLVLMSPILLSIPASTFIKRGLIASSIIILTGGVYIRISNAGSENPLIIPTTLMLILAIHIYILLHKNAKSAFISMSFIFGLIIFLCITMPKPITVFMGRGLEWFGMGGDIPTYIKLNNSEELKGKLKLISLNYIYLQPEHESKVTTIPLNQVTYYKLLDE